MNEDRLVRWSRPLMAWASLVVALGYSVVNPAPDEVILGLLLAAPWGYMGLRQIGKGVEVVSAARVSAARAGS